MPNVTKAKMSAVAVSFIAALALVSFAVAAPDRDGDRRGDRVGDRGAVRGGDRVGDRGGNHDRGYRDGGERVFDGRYHHDHYYPSRGFDVPMVPRASVSVHFGGSNYFYHGGIWYRPFGPRFTVVAPPFGVIVPFLPPFYTTLWVRGLPYYYANDVYYTWHPEDNGYIVTRPPDDEAVSTSATSTNDQLFIYPKNGQSETQQDDDRYQCHTWAAKESSFDPTLPSGGVPANENSDKRAAYFRAMTACLEGRGYSVK